MGRFLAIAAAGLMVLSACGGDDNEAGSGDSEPGASDARTREYVDAVAAVISEDGTAPMEPEMADCMAEAIVEVVGVATLVEAGISAEDFGDADNLSSLDIDVPDETTERLGGALAECDIADAIEEVLVDSFGTSFSGDTDFELSPDEADCLSDNLDDQAVTDAMAGTFVDGSGDHIEQPLLAALAACPSVMTAVLVAQMPSGLPSSAEMCISDFVDGNIDLVTEGFVSQTPSATQELGTALATACPEFANTSS
jgi:hypothetical protein